MYTYIHVYECRTEEVPSLQKMREKRDRKMI
jgi:hypothetical protein